MYLKTQASKIEDLEKKLNEQIEKNVALNKDNAEKTRNEIMSEVASDLADTAKEKFAKLAEEIEWSDAESFKQKCETIKESYFGVKKKSRKTNYMMWLAILLLTKTYRKRWLLTLPL